MPETKVGNKRSLLLLQATLESLRTYALLYLVQSLLTILGLTQNKRFVGVIHEFPLREFVVSDIF